MMLLLMKRIATVTMTVPMLTLVVMLFAHTYVTANSFPTHLLNMMVLRTSTES